MHRIPAAEFLEDLLLAEAGMVGHRKQHHPMATRMAGRLGDRRLIGVHGLRDAALVLKRIRQIEADLDQLGAKLERLPEIALGGDKLAAAHEDECAVVVGLRVIRLDLDSRGESGLGVRDPALRRERIAECIGRRGRPRRRTHRLARTPLGIGEAAEPAAGVRQVSERIGIGAVGREVRPQHIDSVSNASFRIETLGLDRDGATPLRYG